MCGPNAPCKCVCCSSHARSARRRRQRMRERGIDAPPEYAGGDVQERIWLLRQGEIPVEVGLKDPDERVRFEAEILQSTGPAYWEYPREKLERIARETDDSSVLQDIAIEARRRNDEWLLATIVRNPRAPMKALREAEGSPMPTTKAAAVSVMRRRGIEPSEDIAKTGNVRERRALVRQSHPRVAEQLADDKSAQVRRAVAAVAIGAAVGMKMAMDSDTGVRRNLAKNTNHSEVLERLADDHDPATRDLARRRLPYVRGERMAEMDDAELVEFVNSFEDRPAEVELPNGRFAVEGAELVDGHALLRVDPVQSRQALHAGLADCYDLTPAGKQIEVPESFDIFDLFFVSPSGGAGVGVKHGGEISALFSDGTDQGITRPMLTAAQDGGGTWMRSYDTRQAEALEREGGMHPVAKVPFNREHAPDGWDYGAMSRWNDGEPDFVFLIPDAEWRRRGQPDPERFDDFDDAHWHTTLGRG